MSSTTKKHESFVAGPMRNKSVKDIPGVGNVLGDKLKQDNINQARDLLGHFLVKKLEPGACIEFLMDYGANTRHASDAFNAIREWCDNYL